jgi:hypothetical protein
MMRISPIAGGSTKAFQLTVKTSRAVERESIFRSGRHLRFASFWN